jgi:hypothetical protein
VINTHRGISNSFSSNRFLIFISNLNVDAKVHCTRCSCRISRFSYAEVFPSDYSPTAKAASLIEGASWGCKCYFIPISKGVSASPCLIDFKERSTCRSKGHTRNLANAGGVKKADQARAWWPMKDSSLMNTKD